MYDEHDSEILRKVRKRSSKRNSSFSQRISSSTLTEEEMDELFLSEA